MRCITVNTRTIHEPPRRLDGARPEHSMGRPAPAVPGLRAAWVPSAMVAVLMVPAAAAGLWVHGLYHDASWASAAFDPMELPLVAGFLASATLLLRNLRHHPAT
jgi:hypothetical protein